VDEYLALVAKVDAFAQAVAARRAEDVRCRAGCSACCEVELSVCGVEAARIAHALVCLDGPTRARIGARAGRRGRCVMLEDDGRCAVYEARPLVCRTQGLPLAYPEGTLPVATVRARGGADREITFCPLNFEARGPDAADVLDAERVDRTLALVNLRHAEAHGLAPLARVPLGELAAAAPEGPEE